MIDQLKGSPIDHQVPPTRPIRAGDQYFQIRVKGQLSADWADWLDGLEMSLMENGEMILFGRLVDQAALMGVLAKLNRLNLTILSVNEVERGNTIHTEIR